MGDMKYCLDGIPFGGIEGDGTSKYWSNGQPFKYIKSSAETTETITKDIEYFVSTTNDISKGIEYGVTCTSINAYQDGSSIKVEWS